MKHFSNMEEFYKNNREDVKRLCLRFFKNIITGHDWNDVEQTLYLNFLEMNMLNRYDSTKSAFNTYIFMCIRNCLISSFGTKKIKTTREMISLTSFNEDIDNEKTLDYYLGGVETHADDYIYINQLYAKLNKSQEKVLFKEYLKEKRDSEIVGTPGINSKTSAGVATVKKKIRHSIRNLV